MSLFDKKQEINRTAGDKGVRQETQKDASGFGGKPHLSPEEGRTWVRGPEVFKATDIPEARRLEIWGKITRGTGGLFEPKEAERVYQELKDFPKKSQDKYEFKSEDERLKTIRMLEKFLGK